LMKSIEAEHSAGAATADPAGAKPPESDGTGWRIPRMHDLTGGAGDGARMCG
jgi:hypothetical protein